MIPRISQKEKKPKSEGFPDAMFPLSSGCISLLVSLCNKCRVAATRDAHPDFSVLSFTGASSHILACLTAPVAEFSLWHRADTTCHKGPIINNKTFLSLGKFQGFRGLSQELGTRARAHFGKGQTVYHTRLEKDLIKNNTV